jgi:hypothetical protein
MKNGRQPSDVVFLKAQGGADVVQVGAEVAEAGQAADVIALTKGKIGFVAPRGNG